ncbi:MAG: glycosyltransferase [Myxococcales bacterium]|nr:glycosyltransferase [Myxococcales bacterium]
MPDVIIVVPCHNEAERLPADRFVEFAAREPSIHFLFVNDGSTDSTPELLRKLASRDPDRLRVLDLPRNCGKAEAVRMGMRAAFDRNPSYAGYWDADLATPLDAIPSFAELLGERPDLEMVFGSRVKLMGRSIERSAWRHYPGRVLATLSSLTLGLAIYDTQCGAKLFRSSPEIAALFAEPFDANWLFDVELLARFIRARRGSGRPQPKDTIYEFALHEWKDVPGSKIRPWDFFVALVELARIHRRTLRGAGDERRAH